MNSKFCLNLIIIILTSLFLSQPSLAGDLSPVVINEEGFGPSSLLLIIPVSALLGLIVFGFMQSGKKNYKKDSVLSIK